jgi:hypothetical protein
MQQIDEITFVVRQTLVHDNHPKDKEPNSLSRVSSHLTIT